MSLNKLNCVTVLVFLTEPDSGCCRLWFGPACEGREVLSWTNVQIEQAWS